MSPLDSIERHLGKRFTEPGPRGRVVIWTDPEAEFESAVDSLNLPGVTVLHVANNEFAIKKRILRDEPKGKFLIYRGFPASFDLGNWLLDLDLTYEQFSTDKASLVAQEFGAGEALRKVVEQYPTFFKANKRNDALKTRIGPDDDEQDIMAKMIAVLIGSDDHSLDAIWRSLLTENAEGKSSWIDEITRLGLADFHWDGTRRIYGYRSEKPSVDDFVLWLFVRAWEGFASATPNEYRNIQRDFSTWANDLRFSAAYPKLADRAAEELGIENEVIEMDLPALMSRFTFQEVDQQIVLRLAQGVENRTLLDRDVQEMVRRRGAGKTWYTQFENHYQAIAAASTLLARIDSLNLGLATPAEGIRQYVDEWFTIDQSYRKFIWNADKADPKGPLDSLKMKVEAFYTTKFLRPVGDTWQKQVDTLEEWRIGGVAAQTNFFAERIEKPFLDKGQKVAVIISDGLRYEVAEELGRRISEQDRFSTDLSHMLSVFPSYTQLGMAALLPHSTLAFVEGKKALVEVDGLPSSSTKERSVILNNAGGEAIQATEFSLLRADKARELVKTHQVLYVYHNQIDMAGDKVATERTVFRETESTIAELINLAKKLANANVNNIIITADHGFLYQESPLDESDYLSEKSHSDTPLYKNHRFILGHGLKRNDAFTTFTSTQLGMIGKVEAQVPKSVHRLRMPGSGVRYVHGGASLQEIVVPVLAINKKRTTDVRQVAVRIMAEANRITTGQVTITLYQEEPVTEKIKARTLIAGLYAGETLISNEVTVVCSAISAEKRDRFYEINLTLSKEADDFNGQAVDLRLFEPVGTSQRRRYPDTAHFTLVRTFGFEDWN